MRDIIFKQLEERVQAAKIHTGEKLKEDLISIKVYCDLLLEGATETSSTPALAAVVKAKTTVEKPKIVTNEVPASDSLFDF